MNCFDCIHQGRPPAPAVAACVSYGAGVCQTCARVETRPVPHPASVGNPTREQTRAVTCVSCDDTFANHRGHLSHATPS